MGTRTFETMMVAGRFGIGSRASSYANKLFAALDIPEARIVNGKPGPRALLNILDHEIPDEDLVFWFAEVPNEEPKLVGEIKKKNKTCILVTSKRNRRTEGVDAGWQYTFLDLVGRALQTKSNLLVEFGADKPGDQFWARVLDPLGNVFLDKTTNIGHVALALRRRTDELLRFTRVGSQCLGEHPIFVPQEGRFFSLVADYAERFHDLIHGVHSDRLLGNASFRCMEGFPSFRHGRYIYVSRRNIDKRDIGEEGFVGIRLGASDRVEYYGPHKPSVDTPIQVRLYEYYRDIRYMIHSHTYVTGAPFTDRVIPCGAIEEVVEIMRLLPDPFLDYFAVNLRGHGSIVAAKDVDALKSIPYEARPTPEIHRSGYLS